MTTVSSSTRTSPNTTTQTQQSQNTGGTGTTNTGTTGTGTTNTGTTNTGTTNTGTTNTGTTNTGTTNTGTTANAETARDTRTIRLADPSTQQLRGRVEGSFNATSTAPTGTGQGDAPAGTSTARRRGYVVEGAGTTGANTTGTNTGAGVTANEGTSPPSNLNNKVSNLAVTQTGNTPPEGWNQQSNGGYTFNGTGGNDGYTVRQDSNGDMIVRNDGTGQEYSLPAADAQQGATIDTGDGDDNLTIDNSVTAPLTVQGGKGDDRLTAKAGTTADLTLNGGTGNDILTGGDADDDLDGGGGDDQLFGGKGRDALQGGKGADRLEGGDGDDQLHGQEGDDTVLGGDGDDFLMGNAGVDSLDGGAGGDALYADKDDKTIDAGADSDLDLIVSENGAPTATNMSGADTQVGYDPAARDAWLAAHPEFQFSGSAEAQERARADVGVMLGTAQGQGLLNELSTALKAKGETLTIGEKVGEPGGRFTWATNTATAGNWAGRYGDGVNRHPLPALFHELVHGYQDLVSGIPGGSSTFGNAKPKANFERQATGLPWMDASGVVQGPNSLRYTDNLFRIALGLPTRSTYGGEMGPPTGWVQDEGDTHDHLHG